MWEATRDRWCGCVSNGTPPSQAVLSGSRCHHSVPSTNGTWVNHRRSSGDLSGENPRRVGRGSGLCLQKRWNAIARCGRARRAERPLRPAQAGASETPRMAIRDVQAPWNRQRDHGVTPDEHRCSNLREPRKLTLVRRTKGSESTGERQLPKVDSTGHQRSERPIVDAGKWQLASGTPRPKRRGSPSSDLFPGCQMTARWFGTRAGTETYHPWT